MARPNNPQNQYTKYRGYVRITDRFLSALEFLIKKYGNLARTTRAVFGYSRRYYYVIRGARNGQYESVRSDVYLAIIEKAKELGWRWNA